MGYGVIGSPADSGSASLGSSPGTPAEGFAAQVSTDVSRAPSSSGLGHRPLKAAAPVQIRSGLLHISDLPQFGPRFPVGQLSVQPAARDRAAAALVTSAACSRPGDRVSRSIGPDTDSAATTRPLASRTGADTEATPASRSATLAAHPRRRTVANMAAVKAAR